MKSIKRHTFRAILLMAALLLLPTSAWAQSVDAAPTTVLDGTPRVHLLLQLSAIHEAPSVDQLRAMPLEKGLEAALIELAGDDNVLLLARGRAINALAHEAGPETLRFVEDFLAAQAGDNLFLLGRTVRLVGTLSSEYPEWALDLLEPLVSHQDSVLRENVVIALGEVRANDAVAPRVDATLTQLVIAERNPSVQRALHKVLDSKPTLTPIGVAPIRRVVE